MTQAPQKTQAAIAEEIGALVQGLSRARRDLQAGKLLDLSPLGARVTAVCEGVKSLPRDQASPLQPRLVGVLEELDTLMKAARHGLKEVEEQLGAASRRSQAHQAYHKPGR